ncbi:LLM class flavin-dependent oxidoreductase [Paraburkholderia silviterrae]|uniref:LLM class flavin-dependent oxidoreductase n=1 Tax=Paraburkholderia silviterrae TaxID=2528715 RepID=A0A4V2ZY51_9BURK|nr:LLM class flavin-dependent oxidoreductase [Paraburkholderia silviterrae]TDG18783.1 LLM class flavin-dependent oxidoreductase [Paraburkholderia silviterrae]
MKFGIFDQNDRNGLPINQQYEDRLQIIELYDKLGFHAYHMSEHHSTPLSACPSQSVFLAAAAQRTRNLRLAPLVYILPIHHPVRLAEEICMLDHLSGGRFEYGVGRGASPHEIEALGIDPSTAQARYIESYEIVKQFLNSNTLNYDGQFWQFKDVPIEMQPLQTPPPTWYALASPESTVWPAQEKMNIVCAGPVQRVRAITDRYREEFAKRHPSAAEPLMGVNRYIVVADTDEEAMEIGSRAWSTFYPNFFKLWKKHGTEPVNQKLPPTFEPLVESGLAVVGTAETVREKLLEQAHAGGFNYLIGTFMFGDMSVSQARKSIGLFHESVMPAFEELEQVLS